ncbi:MAG: monovalent cation/H+ antiporter subunit D family protein, partial [Gammaproteobacteria bacterium]|nr:monovalent cation/H+ antiporter subunit D family protein [Gammaproteobacteria bacterium]
MLTQLPALAIILPLLSAPLCLFLGRSLLAWLFTIIASGSTMLVSIALLQQVMTTGTIVYEMGGWSAPWGIEYRVDKLNAYLLLIVSSISTVVLLAAHTSVEKEIPQHRIILFYVLYLLSLAGLVGVVITGDAFNVFVFLEVSSLAAYSLIALGEDRRALWA